MLETIWLKPIDMLINSIVGGWGGSRGGSGRVSGSRRKAHKEATVVNYFRVICRDHLGYPE